MSYATAAIFVGLLATVAASSSSSDFSVGNINNLGADLVTCSAPSSSIEVCLSSIFASMEYYLSLVEVSLAQYEISIHNYMHHEHTLLYTEISWVSEANKIAKTVKNAVKIDKQIISVEYTELKYEYNILYSLYYDFYYKIEKIENAISANIIQINNLKKEYVYIKTAKWQLYGYISAIVYEKGAVSVAINEVKKVVGQLNIQITNIYNKITQLTKRQTWLLNWENKLYIDLEAFSKDVKHFRTVQSSLYSRQKSLYVEQTRLKKKAQNIQAAIEQIKIEYAYIVDYISYLEYYEKEIVSIYYSVSYEASQFISGYLEFTCEDNLLYYEACSSGSANVGAAAPAAPAAPAS